MRPAFNRTRIERLTFLLLIAVAFFVGRRLSPPPPAERHMTAAVLPKAERSSVIPNLARGDGTVGPALVTGAVPSSGSKVDRAKIYQQMLTALNEPISTERWMLLAGVLQGLSASNWQGGLQALDDERKLHGRDHADARAFFVRRAGEVIGLDAVAYFLETKDAGAARSALTGWASKSPADALAWLARQSGETGSAPFVGDAIRGLALVEPDLAISFLESVPMADRKKYTPGLVSTVVRTAGVEQSQKLVDDMIARAQANGALGERYLADIFRDLTDIKSRRASLSANIDPAMAWLDQHIGQPYLDGEAVRNAAGQFANQDPLKTITWLDTVNARAKFPGFTAVGYGYVFDTWTNKSGLEPAASWLSGNPTHPSYDRIASHYVDLAVSKDPGLATKFAGTIKDPAIRTSALAQIEKARAASARKR
jgi:hypothetical protein